MARHLSLFGAKAVPLPGMMVGVSVYAIVPARGDSKGISEKNLRRVGGVPLVVRAVHAARSARALTRVFVSTDSEPIAALARQAGAEIIDRPANLSGDEASSESVLLHALDVLQARGDEEPNVVVMVQCTAPFTIAADIDGVVDLVVDGGAGSAFTAARTHRFLWRNGMGGVEAVNHDAACRPRRQDREPEYVETGAVYAMRTDGFRSARHRFFGTIRLFEVPAQRALEIDDAGDLALAEALAGVLPREDAERRLPERIAALALDFDGVLTDNRVVTLEDGTEAIVSDRSDGFGIERLRKAGIPMVVLSKERNPVVAARCRKLSLECVQATEDKASALLAWMNAKSIEPAQVVFVGNDLNDVECLRLAGCGVAVSDAHPAARAAADLVLSRPGGHGAVRELVDLVVERLRGA
jgi:YrbI family 3-deoxy-D-manno-octulosonate 8-phosphate phosphatase